MPLFCADYQRELKSVKRELKEVEQQLEELLTRQSRLLERQTELETVLQNQATKKRQAADTQWEKTGRVHCLCRIMPPRSNRLPTHSRRKQVECIVCAESRHQEMMTLNKYQHTVVGENRVHTMHRTIWKRLIHDGRE